MKNPFKQTDFGDVICKEVSPDDTIQIRLATGERLRVKVIKATPDSLTGFPQVSGMSGYEVEQETFNPDEIVSYRKL